MLVYRIVNLRDGKTYIGVTAGSLRKRWREHLCAARTGNQSPLYRAMRRHGIERFRIEAIYEAADRRELMAVERGLIAQCGTYRPRGYNCTVGGDGAEGAVMPRGEANRKARLTEAIVAFIRRPDLAEITNGHMLKLVESEFGVALSRDGLRDARRGDTWRHVPAPPIRAGQGRRRGERGRDSARHNLNLPHVRAAGAAARRLRLADVNIAEKLGRDQVIAIFSDSRPSRAIAAEYGVDKGTVLNIKSGKTYARYTMENE